MVEGFKLRALELKRNLKISIYLPNNYKEDLSISYPLIITFNGEHLFKFIDSDKRKFDLNELFNESNSNYIVAGIHSPDRLDWLKSELNPYYKGNIETVDTSYSLNFSNYITNDLLPLLKLKYRINNTIYLMGFQDGAIAALNMTYMYDIYKGALIFNPNLNECNNNLYEDLLLRFQSKKRIYLYKGEINSSKLDGELFYKLQTILERIGIEYFILDYDLNSDNSYDSYKDHLINALTIIK